MQGRLTGFYLITLGRLLIILLLFMACRFVFGAMNPSTLPELNLEALAGALRFDITAIFILNLPWLLLSVYPARWSENQTIQAIRSILFCAINCLALLFNLIDCGWFPFTLKRSTADLMFVVGTGNDLLPNLEGYISDYWYLLLIWIGLSFSVLSANKLFNTLGSNHLKKSGQFPAFPIRMGASVLFVIIIVVGFRGGIQLKPLSVQAAASAVPANAIPWVLNTPYTLLKSIDAGRIEVPQFISEEEAVSHFTIHHTVSSDSSFSPTNVIVLTLESFSYDYISFYHPGTATTPFLDSLMRISDCWPNTHANAKRSIEGIPAILASIPSWMDNAFISSPFNVNRINSLASILAKHGYTTGFFHGGQNGTMGFDNFSKLAGYERYYGKDEYGGDPKDFDGHWGIHDHAFYRFMINEIDRWEPPFHAAFFSLSSHHPYPVPVEFVTRVPKGLDKVQRSIAYADLALRDFFKLASSKPWFDNTLFVITADHSGPSRSKYTSSSRGGYHIPLVFYQSQKLQPSLHLEIAQQVDILPTVINLLNVPGTYSSFGRNLFSSEKGWSISYSNGSWQQIGENALWRLDPDGKISRFSLQDTLLSNPQSIGLENQPEALHLKAAVRQFMFSMINNRVVNQ